MKHIFEKNIKKAKEAGKDIVTLRYDVVKRLILKGEYKKLVCDYRYTDDYYWDNVNNFGKGELNRDDAKHVAEEYMRRGTRCYITLDKPDVVRIMIHQNLCYSLYLRESKQAKKTAKKPIEIKNPEQPATRKQLWAIHCITRLDTRNLRISKKTASEWINLATQGVDIRLLVKQALNRTEAV